MRRLIIVLISLFSLVFVIAGNDLWAQSFEVDGFLESYYALRLKEDNDFIGERSRLRLNLRHSSDNIYMFASIDGVSNQILEDDNDLELEINEAYLEYLQPSWDLKVGRQIYSWGKADGLRITDVLSPCDYSEFITRDFDETRMAVDSAKFHYLFDKSDFEVVWIPTFEQSIMPKQGNPWYKESALYQGATINSAEEVEDNLKNSELAARWSFYLNGLDFSLSTAYLWDDEAVYHKTGKNTFTPKYHRLRFYGVDLSKPIDDFVIRFESAYYQGKYFIAKESLEGVMKKDYLMSVVGLDWYPGNDWTITGQLANNYIVDYDNLINSDESSYITTLNITKKLLRQTLEIGNMIYYDLDNQAGLERISVDYALTDDLHLLSGIDYFFADDEHKSKIDNQFGRYDGNDSLWVKIKYNF